MKQHPLERYLPAGVEPIWAEIRDVSYSPGPTHLEGLEWSIENIHDEMNPKPADLTLFRMRANVHIGPRGGEGAHEFSLWVISRRWLAEELAHDIGGVSFRTDPQHWGSALSDFLSPTFIMETWDQEVLERRLHDLCWEIGPGPDWGSVAMRLGQWFDGPVDSFNYYAAVNESFGQPFWGTGRTSP